MKVTQIFEFTKEELEHFKFVIKLLREMEGDETIKDRLSQYHLCDNTADNLEEILDCVEGEHFYTVDIPEEIDWE